MNTNSEDWTLCVLLFVFLLSICLSITNVFQALYVIFINCSLLPSAYGVGRGCQLTGPWSLAPGPFMADGVGEGGGVVGTLVSGSKFLSGDAKGWGEGWYPSQDLHHPTHPHSWRGYATCGTPLVVTQEDCLAFNKFVQSICDQMTKFVVKKEYLAQGTKFSSVGLAHCYTNSYLIFNISKRYFWISYICWNLW